VEEICLREVRYGQKNEGRINMLTAILKHCHDDMKSKPNAHTGSVKLMPFLDDSIAHEGYLNIQYDPRRDFGRGKEFRQIIHLNMTDCIFFFFFFSAMGRGKEIFTNYTCLRAIACENF